MPRLTRIAAAAACGWIASCAPAAPLEATPADVGAPGPPADPALERLGAASELPGLDGQATERGLRIGSLHRFDGRLFVGYGDYSDNTGPISVLSRDLLSGAWHGSAPLDTEEVLRFVEHDSTLFTPTIDPTGHQADGSAFARQPDGEWANMTPIDGAVHVYSLVSLEGRLWAATGCLTAAVARVASTADGGQTWRDEHTTQAPDGSFARYTHLGVAGGRLFAGGWISASPRQQIAWLRTDDSWEPIADLPEAGFLVPLGFDERLVVANFSGDVGKGGDYRGAFEIEGGGLVPAEPFPPDAEPVNWESGSDGSLVALLGTGGRDGAWTVDVPDGDGGWTRVAEPPPPAQGRYTAVAVDSDVVYLGASDGSLYRYGP